MLYELPKNTKLWEGMPKFAPNSLRTEGNIQAATDFYSAHREAMDAGAHVAWEERFNHDEISPSSMQ
jgi:hypothetical protein